MEIHTAMLRAGILVMTEAENMTISYLLERLSKLVCQLPYFQSCIPPSLIEGFL